MIILKDVAGNPELEPVISVSLNAEKHNLRTQKNDEHLES